MDFAKLVRDSLARLQEARRIADDLSGDDRSHRLAMMAVFALEDVYEALQRTPNIAAHAEVERRW